MKAREKPIRPGRYELLGLGLTAFFSSGLEVRKFLEIAENRNAPRRGDSLRIGYANWIACRDGEQSAAPLKIRHCKK
jgi:hypothetical protein